METLIELYDERPLENVLGVEMFRPARVVYVSGSGAESAAQIDVATNPEAVCRHNSRRKEKDPYTPEPSTAWTFRPFGKYG